MKFLLVAMLGVLGVSQAVQAETCRANLVSMRRGVVQSYTGYGWDRREACTEARMRCDRDLRYYQRRGQMPRAYCEVSRGGYNPYPPRRPAPRPRPRPRPLPPTRTIQEVSCGSWDRKYTECGVAGTIINAYVKSQYSSASCRRGVSWGVRGNSIWVSNGCRASFGVETRSRGHHRY